MANHRLYTSKIEVLHSDSAAKLRVATVKLEALVRIAPGTTYEDTISDTVDLTPSEATTTTYNLVEAQTVNLGDEAYYGQYFETVEYTITFTEDLSRQIQVANSDTINTTPTLTVVAPKTVSETEAILASETLVAGRRHIDALTQAMRTSYRIAAARRQVVSETDAVDVTPALTYDYRPGALILEVVNIALAQTPTHKFNKTLSQAISMADTPSAPFAKILSDTINITEAAGFVQAATMLETIQIGLTDIASTRKYLTLAQTLELADSLAKYVSEAVSETIDVTPALTRMFRGVVIEAQTFTVAPTVAPTLYVTATIAEGVDIDDTDLAKLAYSATVSDGVSFGLSFVSPSGNLTAWAVNTSTTAVTEYQNFEFNSFASNGNHYVGANSAGLYELAGADDAGTSITALIRSGRLSLNGTRQMRWKAAYIGTTTGGEYLLKLIDEGSGEISYQVLSNAVQTSKVWLGKGLRSRYWQFELSNVDGQDFDLESIEFVPLMVKRRV